MRLVVVIAVVLGLAGTLTSHDKARQQADAAPMSQEAFGTAWK